MSLLDIIYNAVILLFVAVPTGYSNSYAAYSMSGESHRSPISAHINSHIDGNRDVQHQESRSTILQDKSCSGQQRQRSPNIRIIPPMSNFEVEPALTPIHIETTFYEERVYWLYDIVNAVKLYPGGLPAWLLEKLNTYPLSGTIEERWLKDPLTGVSYSIVIVLMKGSDVNCELACEDILLSEKWSCDLQSKQSIAPPLDSPLHMFKIIPSVDKFPQKKELSSVNISETSSNFDLYRSCLQTETSVLGGDEILNKALLGDLDYSITEVSSVLDSPIAVSDVDEPNSIGEDSYLHRLIEEVAINT